MKKVFILTLTIFFLFLALFLSFLYYNHLKQTYPKTVNLQKLVHLNFVLPSKIPQKEAVLLPDNNPLIISLLYKNEIADKYKLKNRFEKILWQCSSGELDKKTGSGNNEWFPPHNQSVTSKITVNFSGEYYSPLGRILFGIIPIEKELYIKLISPISSSFINNNGCIDGYNIGTYLNPYDENTLRKYPHDSHHPRLHPEKYLKPKFLHKITKENKDLYISPHIKLGDFAIDYPWFSLGMPQYIALDFNLIKKLEDLIELMNKDGFNIKKNSVIYGFRPPTYNVGSIVHDGAEFTLKAIWSMHQYGKAIDIIIDNDNDLVIDDLNKDGKIDMKDPAIIMHYVNILDRKHREAGNLDMVGGAGLYSHNDFWQRKQTPYIHIDVRGFLETDGKLIRWPSKWEDGSLILWGKL